MKSITILSTLTAIGVLTMCGCATTNNKPDQPPVVSINTSLGAIKIRLLPHIAPLTVENFLKYTDDGFYDGLIFHRVMPGFMIQGGGFSTSMHPEETRLPIINEANADLPNTRGTIAMARTSDINSATSQFFINQIDNTSLDHKADNPRDFGYCVFGTVVEGMDIVDKIAVVETRQHGPHSNVPSIPVIIKSVTLCE